MIERAKRSAHGSVGVYLTAERVGYPCARLPVGIKWTPEPWTWFSLVMDPMVRLLATCPLEPTRPGKRGPQLSVECRVCPLGHNIQHVFHGLVWSAAPRAEELAAWAEHGVSVSVPFFPVGLRFGKTVVFVARHMKLGTYEYAITDCVTVTGVDLVVEAEPMRELAQDMARQIGPEARLVFEGEREP